AAPVPAPVRLSVGQLARTRREPRSGWVGRTVARSARVRPADLRVPAPSPAGRLRARLVERSTPAHGGHQPWTARLAARRRRWGPAPSPAAAATARSA